MPVAAEAHQSMPCHWQLHGKKAASLLLPKYSQGQTRTPEHDGLQPFPTLPIGQPLAKCAGVAGYHGLTKLVAVLRCSIARIDQNLQTEVNTSRSALASAILQKAETLKAHSKCMCVPNSSAKIYWTNAFIIL